MNKAMQVVVGLLVLVVVAGGSFYGGMVFGESQAEAALASVSAQAGGLPADAQAPGTFGQRRQLDDAAGVDAMAGMTVGQIESAEGQTLVITDQNGQQIRVQVTDTTLIEKQASVTIAELEIGETVMISGSENDDGSITARSVRSAPAGRFGGQAPGGAVAGQ